MITTLLIKIEAELPNVWKDAREPNFHKKGRCHNWRNYIPEQIQDVWHDLPLETRVLLIYVAEQGADREEWD